MRLKQNASQAVTGVKRHARVRACCVVSLAGMAVVAGINIAFAGYLTTHAQYAPLLSILYLLAMIASAWWGGYVTGVFVVISCICVSTFVGTGRLSIHNLPVLGTAAFIGISLLVSSVAASRRRVERVLRSSNEQLETKVKQRTAELESARTWLEITLESIGDAVIATDNDGRVVLLNGVAETLTGWSQQEASGRPLRDVFVIVNEITRASAEDPVAKVLLTGTVVGLANHTVLISRRGDEIDIDDSAAPIRTVEGELAGVVLTFRDVTERRRADLAAEESRLALEELNTALERTNTDLQQFAYAASHDLREPLRNIVAYSQLLGKRCSGQLDKDAETCIGFVVRGALRMEALLKDLLAYTQTFAATKDAANLCDANTVLQDVLSNFRATVADTGAYITQDPLGELPVDGVHLQQLFQNLIGNAIKYRGESSPIIHISAELRGTEWIFSVADNGIGIDPRYREKIFGLFKRLHTADKYAGTGLGLAICQKIVQRYGGRIWVESELGNGSVFRFTLPSAPGAQDEKQ